jgi:hypothetical protein
MRGGGNILSCACVKKVRMFTIRFATTIFTFHCITEQGTRMWPFSALMGTSSKNMFTARELKVGKRYKVPNNRGMDPCSTLTRKRHLANGTRYALTFDSGKKRRWQFYNFNDNPVFKACQTRRRKR